MAFLRLTLFSLGLVVALVSSTESDITDVEKSEYETVGRLLLMKAQNYDVYLQNSGQQFEPQAVKDSFPCGHLDPSPTVPVSVHSLRPGDIKVLGALGDSLTAGRGADGGVLGLLVDYRGLSWSIGIDGDYDSTGTLPTILRKYNEGIYGGSSGVGDTNAKFNVAQTGAKSATLHDQANILVEKMKNDSKVDFEKDWKVITVFIGGNDLCKYCDDKEEYTADKYKANLQQALDILHQNVPRALVNLVEVLNVEIAKDLAGDFFCQIIHSSVCRCAASPASKAEEDYLIKLKGDYQQAARDLASSGRYDTRDDFTVVLQPFYRNTFLPRTKSGGVDLSYFAKDCFHHSKKGQRAAAEALWNNMIEPVGQKTLEWTPGEVIKCPNEDRPFFYTNKNSQSTQQ